MRTLLKDYIECRGWLESFIPLVYGKEELGFKRIENLLEKLGNPQTKFRSVLVAGTAGKGSTAFYIAQLLQIAGPVSPFPPTSARSDQKNNVKGRNSADLRADGIPSRTATRNLKIGLHVSPHLVDIRERMQINGKIVPLTRFVGLVNKIKPVVDDIIAKQPQIIPSYFEILVALAFLYFAEERVDFAVVEVGLGGRLDATNVLVPEVAVITNVGLDHTEILGKTIEKIAREKAGIIKGTKQKARLLSMSKARSKAWLLTGSLVVTGATGKALKVIEKVVKTKKASLITLDTRQGVKTPKSDVFRYISRPYYLLRYTGNLFAVQNKNLALLSVLSLGVKLNSDSVKQAFSRGFTGRFEQVDDGVVLDGAHNPDKIRALVEFIGKFQISNFKFQIVLVVAFKQGKNWEKMVDLLLKSLPVKKIIATEYQSVTDMGLGSAVDASEISKYIVTRYQRPVKVIRNSQEAVFKAIESGFTPGVESGRDLGNAGVSNRLVLVTGSLYLVGEARTLWHLPEF